MTKKHPLVFNIVDHWMLWDVLNVIPDSELLQSNTTSTRYHYRRSDANSHHILSVSHFWLRESDVIRNHCSSGASNPRREFYALPHCATTTGQFVVNIEIIWSAKTLTRYEYKIKIDSIHNR